MDTKTMTQAQVKEWFRNARIFMGDELAGMMEAHLAEVEESHAEMVRALMEAETFMVLLLNGDPKWQRVDREALRAKMFNALKKAGAL